MADCVGESHLCWTHKTSNDCSCLKRHKNWKSHPEKMVRNAVEVHKTAEAGSHTDAHTQPLVTPGQTGHWGFPKAQHESCKQPQQIILRKKSKTKKQVIKALAKIVCIPPYQMLESNTPLQVPFIASSVNNNFLPQRLPTAYYAIAMHAAILAHVRTWRENIPGRCSGDRLCPSRRQM